MDTWVGCGYRTSSLNRFVYSESDPVNKIDPSGNFAITLSLNNSIAGILATANIARVGIRVAVLAASIVYGDYIVRNNNIALSIDQSLSSNEVKEKSTERKAYKSRCTEPEPPGLSGCDRLRWLLKRNQDCKEMRERFSEKWYKDNDPNHVGEIINLQVAIDGLLEDIEKLCK